MNMYLPYSRTQQALQNLGETLRNMSIQKTQTEALKIGERVKLAELGVRGAEVASQTKLGTLSTLARLESEKSQQDYYAMQRSDIEARREADRVRALREEELNRSGTVEQFWKENWTGAGIPTEEQEKQLSFYRRHPIASKLLSRTTTKRALSDVEKFMDETMVKDVEWQRRLAEGEPKVEMDLMKQHQDRIDTYNKRKTELVNMRSQLDRTTNIDPTQANFAKMFGITLQVGGVLEPEAKKALQMQIDAEIGRINELIPYYESEVNRIKYKDVLAGLETQLPASQYPNKKTNPDQETGLIMQSKQQPDGSWKWEIINNESQKIKEPLESELYRQKMGLE